MKKIFTIISLFIFIGVSTNTVEANENVVELKENTLRRATHVKWKYEYEDDGYYYKLWEYKGKTSPATRDEETRSKSVSSTQSHTYSGTIGGNIKLVEVSLGYSFGTSKTYTDSATTSPLEEGEYVEIYSRDVFEQTVVTSLEYTSLAGQPYKLSSTESAEAREFVNTEIKFEYYRERNNLRSLDNDDEPFKTEYYEFIDGKLVLISVE